MNYEIFPVNTLGFNSSHDHFAGGFETLRQIKHKNTEFKKYKVRQGS